jgi:hypothetical protein
MVSSKTNWGFPARWGVRGGGAPIGGLDGQNGGGRGRVDHGTGGDGGSLKSRGPWQGEVVAGTGRWGTVSLQQGAAHVRRGMPCFH